MHREQGVPELDEKRQRNHTKKEPPREGSLKKKPLREGSLKKEPLREGSLKKEPLREGSLIDGLQLSGKSPVA